MSPTMCSADSHTTSCHTDKQPTRHHSAYLAVCLSSAHCDTLPILGLMKLLCWQEAAADQREGKVRALSCVGRMRNWKAAQAFTHWRDHLSYQKVGMQLPSTAICLPLRTSNMPKALLVCIYLVGEPSPLPTRVTMHMQELKARVAPVLARWQNKLLAQALEAFHSNTQASRSKRVQVEKALQYWNNRALAGAFAQWICTMEVITKTAHKIVNAQVPLPCLDAARGTHVSCHCSSTSLTRDYVDLAGPTSSVCLTFAPTTC